MSINTSVQTFTDTELLNLWRLCFATISVGQSYTLNGRMMTKANLQEVRDTIDWLEGRINAADAEATGGMAIVQFGERQ